MSFIKFKTIDDTTTGPRSFSGDIGKALKDCETLPLKPFQAMESLPVITNESDLSTDQLYLFQFGIW